MERSLYNPIGFPYISGEAVVKESSRFRNFAYVGKDSFTTGLKITVSLASVRIFNRKLVLVRANKVGMPKS